MFLLSKPTESRIRATLALQRAEKFSYREVGESRGSCPAGYKLLGGRIELGHGSAAFDRAVEAFRQWKMFDVPGVQLCWPDAAIQAGVDVAILIRHFGFWSLNFCRIVYVIDEQGPLQRFGFAYGTLPEHAERGEERFTVERNPTSDSVSYDIWSFSRPGSVLPWIGLPAARRLQRRFVRESLAAMVNATGARVSL